MGLGKKFKKALGKVIKEIPGAKKAVGNLPIIRSAVATQERDKEALKNTLINAEQQAQQTDALNAQIAEQTQQRLLSEADLKRQEEELKKRTTFAGSSMQSVMERKKLLGI
jgi:hypothetical protein